MKVFFEMASSVMPSSNKSLNSTKMNIEAKRSDIFSFTRRKNKERMDVVNDYNIDNNESNNIHSLDENNVILKEEDIFKQGIKRSNGTLGEQVINTDKKMNVTRITDEIVFKDDKNNSISTRTFRAIQIQRQKQVRRKIST